ncbi:MAG: hypothetical protein FPO08_10425 [Geobacter sp.]|nr:MAG: hypothetical protein FPO08_10425 [Geobacter sp.]
MALSFHPKPGMVLMCDFSKGFRPPEIVKVRPVVVISPRPRRRTQLCTVIPLSSTAPSPVEPHHHKLDPASLPQALAGTETWAKCDLIMTVCLDRLDRVKGRDPKTGQRLYTTSEVTAADFDAIQGAVVAALGLPKI